MAYEVKLDTPVVVTEAELDEPYTMDDVRAVAIDQLIELLERAREGKHGTEVRLKVKPV
jgi:hypothetical protein